MADPTPLSDAAFNRLERTILHNPSASARQAALLEIQQMAHPGINDLLRQVIAEEKDPEVRDLAQNLLRQRELQTRLDTGAFADADPPTIDDLMRVPYQDEETAAPRSRFSRDTWDCRFCGSENRGGDHCAACGAERGADRPAAAPRKRPDDPHSFDDVFLLYPGNRLFISGNSRRIAGMSVGCGLLFMLPFLLVGVFTLFLALNAWNDYTVLNTTGVKVIGQYTGRHYNDDDDGTTYYASYQYTVGDTVYNGEQSIGSDLYNRVERGASVEIIYAPGNPGLSRLASTDMLAEPLFMTAFTVFWNLISWGIFLGILLGRRRDQRLVREGQLVRGEIRSISGTTDSDGDFQLRVEYRFTPPDGGETIFRTETQQRNDMKNVTLPPQGTPVAILYRDRQTFKLL
jgi:hypothetical protein